MRIFWAGVNTATTLGCGPNNRTETQLKRWSQSGSKQTLVRLNGWTNEWMTLSTCVVLFTVSGSLAKRAINIVFGPDRSKWTSRLSWCEYTLSKLALLWATGISLTMAVFKLRNHYVLLPPRSKWCSWLEPRVRRDECGGCLAQWASGWERRNVTYFLLSSRIEAPSVWDV